MSLGLKYALLRRGTSVVVPSRCFLGYETLFHTVFVHRLGPVSFQKAVAETESTSKRFTQYQGVLARESASFWRENVIAVVILLGVFAR